MPLCNFSLPRVLRTESDNLKKARISIVLTIIIFSLLKLLVALPTAWIYDQQLQFLRFVVFLFVILILLKYLLKDGKHAGPIGVIMIWIGLALTWSNVLVTAQSINIVTIQVVVTIILSSFYLLNWRWALTYSFLGVLPIIILLLAGENISFNRFVPEQLASPAYEIIIVLNFLTIVITHFLYYQALNRNVLEMEALNMKLQEAVRDANLAVQSKADFLSTMSHELRTPLNSVIGMTQLLLNSPFLPEQAENLKIVNFSARNLHMLINDILDFNKMESDKLNLESIEVDLVGLLNDISAGLRFQAQEKGLVLHTHIDPEIDNFHVITDPTRLTQIIHNLSGNAIKFTPSGSVTLTLSVLATQGDQRLIGFSVADTGIGISEAEQEFIFDAFTQASSSTTRNFGGTGLGLTIVKRLLRLFNSDIHVRSTEGAGADFYFQILFNTIASSTVRKDDLLPKDRELGQLKVLVVEDNPINSLLIKKIFSSWNNNPVFAGNGHEAIEQLLQDDFDVILMDIHMPLLDGYETTRKIRQLADRVKAGTPVIALTASVSNDLQLKIKESGMNDYINKPFNADELYRKLKTLNSAKKTVAS